MAPYNPELPYYIAFSRFGQIGPERIGRLLHYFTSLQVAWNASAGELVKAGIDQKISWELVEGRKTIDPEKELGLLEREGVSAILCNDPEYPQYLSEIYQPPYVLYYRGTWPPRGLVGFGVVGTRNITPYGRSVTPGIVRDLARAGFVIVSGLALGVDALAHQSALEVGGNTIAVLGTGVDRWSVYPSSNRTLADRIIESGGLVLSEYPIGTEPLKHHFPARNRIISGLSVGVLVIEADEKSGALITARCALEQNRDVFAVPGPIGNPMSRGPHSLLKQGAKLVTGAEDIIESYEFMHTEETNQGSGASCENSTQQMIYEHLSHEPLYIDEIALRCQLDTATANSTLLIMEMKGLVKNSGSMCYIKVS
ncbi:MAG: DNA-processing protein DprA [bacterium]|nr:DNA-processing protein DprA [bacterium]